MTEVVVVAQREPLVREVAKHKNNNKKKKSVRIELSRNRTKVLNENLCLCADDIWYSSDDFVHMKSQSKCEAKEWRRQGLGVLLKETFALPRSDAQICINAFCRMDDDDNQSSRRGLERSLSRRHGEERSDLKDQARQSVLIHQDRLKRQGTKPDELTENLARMYKETCRCAKVFARRFGIADELAVTLGDDSSVAAQIMEAERQLDNKAGSATGGRKASRRFSNASLASNYSVNSFDSNHRFMGGGERSLALPKRTSSRSPVTPSEEFYAAIA